MNEDQFTVLLRDNIANTLNFIVSNESVLSQSIIIMYREHIQHIRTSLDFSSRIKCKSHQRK